MDRISHYFKNLLDSVRFKKGRTVKTMFSLLSIALLLGAAAISGNTASYIRLQTDKTSVKAGDHFMLDVYAYASVPVNAIDVTLKFKEGTVDVVGIDKGQSVLTIWTQEPKVEKDKVVISGGTFRNGFVGEHKIITLDLVAKQTGQSTFSASDVQLLAGDGKGTPVKTAESDASSVSFYVYDEKSADPSKIAINVSVGIVSDIDGDGKVSLKDVSSFMGAWANSSHIYDFNGDGKMTFGDFSIILADVFLGH
jgi:hypothetical protein